MGVVGARDTVYASTVSSVYSLSAGVSASIFVSPVVSKIYFNVVDGATRMTFPHPC